MKIEDIKKASQLVDSIDSAKGIISDLKKRHTATKLEVVYITHTNKTERNTIDLSSYSKIGFFGNNFADDIFNRIIQEYERYIDSLQKQLNAML